MSYIFILSMVLVACSADESSSVEQIDERITQTDEIIEMPEEQIIEDEISDISKVEISMEDAIAIGKEEANKYYDNLKLTEAHSYDNDYEPNISAGENGKREWWYVNFANENQDYVLILIKNNEIVQVENFEGEWNNGLIEISDINLTVEEAVQKAKELGLRGGDPANDDEWVSGYNFKLEYSSLIDSPEDRRIFLEVIGISPNGNFARIDFDATTAELLLAEEKLELSDESVEWRALE